MDVNVLWLGATEKQQVGKTVWQEKMEKPSTLGNSPEITIEVKELKNDEERNQN